MDNTLKILLWVITAIVLFWLVLQIVGFIFAIVNWLVSVIITLAIVGVLLYVGYLLLSRMFGSSSGTPEHQRERIFE